MPLLRRLARIWFFGLAITVATLALGLLTRFLAPYAPWNDAPVLAATTPNNGAVDVLPRSMITLTFSRPMNRGATIDALRIDPPTAGRFGWSDDGRTLSFQPERAFSPAISYTLSLGPGAMSRWWRPIDSRAQISFSTATLPSVVTALPDGSGVARDGSIAVIFSQPMVSAATLGQPVNLSTLKIDPPVELTARWETPNTLLLRPTAMLAAAQRYTVTVGSALADLRGVELGAPYSWSFTTAWPAVIDLQPADGARWVSPHQPLTLRLDAPLPSTLIERALQLDPPVDGTVESAIIGATQLITFTPQLGWEHGSTYVAKLVAPPGSDLADPPVTPWRFNVEPPPGLVAFFPGQGQLLPPGQAVRLIFATPMDADSLRAGLRIEPSVADPSISVDETEVRLLPELQASTTYTITIAAATRDRSGEPLGAETTVQLRTTAAAPALRVPAAAQRPLISVPVNQTTIEFERTNLDTLNLEIYKLDAPTLLRALNLTKDEWDSFNPERYGQSLGRRWQLNLPGIANQPTRTPINVALVEGQPLDPGAYYLRATSPQGPRSDLLLLVTSVNLILRQSDSQILVWATDASSGAPLADLPLALYAADALITRGRTDASGVWALPVQRQPDDPPYLVLAEGSAPAVVSGAQLAGLDQSSEPRQRSLLFLDRLSYSPGDQVRVGGLTRRQAADGSLTLPTNTACQLKLQEVEGPAPPAPQQPGCQVDPATGIVSATLQLSPRQLPGHYELQVEVSDEMVSLPLEVIGPQSDTRVEFQPGDSSIAVQLERDGLPLAGTMVSWTMRLQPQPAPVVEGFHFATPAAESHILSGSGLSDSNGRLDIAISLPAGMSSALRYQIDATIGAEGSAQTQAGGHGLVGGSRPYIGIRLPSRFVRDNQRGIVELIAVDSRGQPVAGVPITVHLYRPGKPTGQGTTPLLSRNATSNAQGRADIEIVQLNPGAYDVEAGSGGLTTRQALWVSSSRFTGWQNPPGQVSVIAERSVYRPGDVVQLLVTSPYAEANLLLTIEHGSLHDSLVRSLRAGQPITFTITPDMIPGVNVGATLAAGAERRVGSASLLVQDDQPAPNVSLSSEHNTYPPGATAALTITSDPGLIISDTLLTITPVDAEPMTPSTLKRLMPGPPPAMTVAGISDLEPGIKSQSAELTIGASGYLTHPLDRAGGNGQWISRVTLPDRPGSWWVTMYAATRAEQIAVASTLISTSVPLELTPIVPSLLRPSDRAKAELRVHNTTALTQELQIRLQAAGADIDVQTPTERRLQLAPGATQQLTWTFSPRPGVQVVSLRISSGSSVPIIVRDLPVVASVSPPFQSRTISAAGDLNTSLGLDGPLAGSLELAVAPGLRATLEDTAESLAALSTRSVEQRASLLLLSAQLGLSAPSTDQTRWIAMAERAADELRAAQNADGGWGWWPGLESRPFVSALVVEAEIIATRLSRTIRAPDSRTLAYLTNAAPAADPDTQAYIAYVRTLTGDRTVDAKALLNLSPGSAGLAYLLMILPAPLDDEAATRLLALAERPGLKPGEAARLFWPSGSESEMPGNSTAVTAAVVQALHAERPDAAESLAGERSLLAAWSTDGWADSFTAARVAAALLSRQPAAAHGPQRITLNGATVLDTSRPITSTTHLHVPAKGLDADSRLEVTAPGSTGYLLALRATAATGSAESVPTIVVQQELIDPVTGTGIDPSSLRTGQIAELRLSIVSAQALRGADLEIDLPGALQAVDYTPTAPFVAVNYEPQDNRLRFNAFELKPAVITQRITVRAIAAGSYVSPAARLVPRYEDTPPVTARESWQVRVEP